MDSSLPSAPSFMMPSSMNLNLKVPFILRGLPLALPGLMATLLVGEFPADLDGSLDQTISMRDWETIKSPWWRWMEVCQMCEQFHERNSKVYISDWWHVWQIKNDVKEFLVKLTFPVPSVGLRLSVGFSPCNILWETSWDEGGCDQEEMLGWIIFKTLAFS